jgi:AcrR family transcriptional regulator
MTPRPGLRERKNSEVKLTLFKAAMRLFQEKGFDATSVDEIAEQAGFSRATYFNHFGTKQGVLRYFGERLQERMERLLSEADPSSTPLERIRAMIFEMGREAERHRDDLKPVLLYSLRDPEYFARPTPARMRVLKMMSDLVSEAQRTGQVRRDLSAREQAHHILSLYQSVVLAVVLGMGTAEPMLRSAWAFILGGVRDGDSLTR